MPELPEVETIRRGLQAPLVGRRIVRATLYRTDICTAPGQKTCRRSHLLEGAIISHLARRGKQMAIIAEDGRILVVQLGMSGQMRVLAPGEVRPPTHVHAEWLVDTGSVIIFRDPRRFGGLAALLDPAALETRWSLLGPDALSITGPELAAALEGSRRAVKAALLDQRAIAGVGNIYADEALFRARIRPDRLCTTLGRRDFSRLAAAVRRSLEVAIEAGGSTLRDYTTATGGPGGAQEAHRVYGRCGETCTRCRGILEGLRLAGRATVFCPRCQR
jgi:formamidopyrimidine-DNA glycosylase